MLSIITILLIVYIISIYGTIMALTYTDEDINGGTALIILTPIVNTIMTIILVFMKLLDNNNK